jgi:alanine racemase
MPANAEKEVDVSEEYSRPPVGSPFPEIPGEEAGGILTIDLDAVASNWRTLQKRVGDAACAGVVKADAYGLGLEPVVYALSKQGCGVFFVAHISEGKRVHAVNREATIYVLNGFFPENAETYLHAGLRPVLGSFEEIRQWLVVFPDKASAPPAAVKVNTGMNRMGLTVEEALSPEGKALLSQLNLKLIVSHFACSEEPGHPAVQKQLEAFRAVRGAWPGIPGSLANSSGVFLPEAPYFEVVRPGYALYGGNPTPGKPNPMKPVVRLEVKVLATRSVDAGAAVGYNGRWTAAKPSRLAALHVGYADGFLRSQSGTDDKIRAGAAAAGVLIGGTPCPVVGRVSMDLTLVDVSALPAQALKRGTRAVVIGDGLSIDDVAGPAGTIGYEILTSLGRRYSRRYIGKDL